MLKVVETSMDVLSNVAVGSVVKIYGYRELFIVLGYDDSWKLWKCFNLETREYSYFDDFDCYGFKVVSE